MAGNEVKLTIRIGDNGSLDIVTKKTKKATKETEKLANASEKVRKSRNRYSKGEKGVAQAGLSSAKSFSKMQSSMTGSGGLVPAYATLAANVFAATAAFCCAGVCFFPPLVACWNMGDDPRLGVSEDVTELLPNANALAICEFFVFWLCFITCTMVPKTLINWRRSDSSTR